MSIPTQKIKIKSHVYDNIETMAENKRLTRDTKDLITMLKRRPYTHQNAWAALATKWNKIEKGSNQ